MDSCSCEAAATSDRGSSRNQNCGATPPPPPQHGQQQQQQQCEHHVDASDVYILQETSILRRAANHREKTRWLYEIFGQPMQRNTYPSDRYSFRVLSALPDVSHDSTGEHTIYDSNGKLQHCDYAVLQPSTRVHFLASSYKIAISLDISPSMTSMNNETGTVIFSDLFGALAKSLYRLVQDVRVPACDELLRPAIWLTVLAQTQPNLQPLHPVQVLVQGALLTQQSLPDLLATLQRQFTEIENQLLNAGSSIPAAPPLPSPSSSLVHTTQAKQESEARELLEDNAFTKSVLNGIFSLSLLPEFAAVRLVVMTDGVVSVPDQTNMDALLEQLLASNTTCSFLQVTSINSMDCSLGMVPDSELLHFIAMSSFGSLLFANEIPAVDDPSQLGVLFTPSFLQERPLRLLSGGMDLCHRSLLVSRHDGGSLPHLCIVQSKTDYIVREMNQFHSLSRALFKPDVVPLVRRKWRSYNVHIDAHSYALLCGVFVVETKRVHQPLWFCTSISFTICMLLVTHTHLLSPYLCVFFRHILRSSSSI
jgi:hypothetical protein